MLLLLGNYERIGLFSSLRRRPDLTWRQNGRSRWSGFGGFLYLISKIVTFCIRMASYVLVFFHTGRTQRGLEGFGFSTFRIRLRILFGPGTPIWFGACGEILGILIRCSVAVKSEPSIRKTCGMLLSIGASSSRSIVALTLVWIGGL